MANVRLPAATRNDLVQRVQVLIDAGAGAGTIKIYDGTQPANGGDAITTQVLLAELTFNDPSSPAAAGGSISFNAITSDTAANNTGTATWARVADSNAVTIFDCDVTVTGGGGTITLNSVGITAGIIVSLTSFSVTMPAS